MAKKKTSRVSPVVPKRSVRQPLYDDLNNGDAFLYEGALYVKVDTDDQQAIDLDTGYIEDSLCGKIVVPVNITVKWSRK